ncbi:MAG: hypothetical protein HND47_20775 [Chloroflexi bacterium]|nr:hypothetical protein [Chloroflexota bacterium]
MTWSMRTVPLILISPSAVYFSAFETRFSKHLLQPVFIAEDDGKILREIGDEFVFGRLGRKARSHPGRKAGQRDIGLIQAETSRLQPRGVEQIVNHFGEAVRFLLDDGE